MTMTTMKFLALAALLRVGDAFTAHGRSATSATATAPRVAPFMAARGDDDNVEEASAAEGVSPEAEASVEEEKGAQAEPVIEEEPPVIEEDPEVTALKGQIADLESSLKSKRRTLSYARDQADNFSKAGYARKVAEMENMRRVRSNLNTSSRSSAAANVLGNFVPIYDQLAELKLKYADDEFGSKMGGLTMSPTFSAMGVTEFRVRVGDAFDDHRMSASDRVRDDEVPADAVVDVEGPPGLELEGNVLRPVSCVVSMGPRAAEEEAPEQAAAEEEEAVQE